MNKMVNLHNVSIFDVERIKIRQEQNANGDTRWLKITLIPKEGQHSHITVFAQPDGSYPTVEVEQSIDDLVPLPAS